MLILLPTSANKLITQWKGPYKVIQRIGENDYKLDIHARMSTYHINMLKKYNRSERDDGDEMEDRKEEEIVAVATVIEDGCMDGEVIEHELIPTYNCWQKETYRDVKINPDLRTEDRVKLIVEAKKIKRSLSALADVINALRVKQKHIPYRNSITDISTSE